MYVAEDVDRRDAHPQEEEEFEVVRWSIAEIESRLAELEDAKTIAGLLLYVQSRREA